MAPGSCAGEQAQESTAIVPGPRTRNSLASLLEHLVGVFGLVRLLLRYGLELSLREEFGF